MSATHGFPVRTLRWSRPDSDQLTIITGSRAQRPLTRSSNPWVRTAEGLAWRGRHGSSLANKLFDEAGTETAQDVLGAGLRQVVGDLAGHSSNAEYERCCRTHRRCA
jgi:hypothetical protein